MLAEQRRVMPLVWILLASVGVEMAFMFGILTVLLNFIPNVGSLFAIILPLPILILQFGLGWQLPFVMIVSTTIQFSIGNVLEPKLMGDSLGLHPMTVLVFLLFWGMVWGIPGMFMAAPMTSILKMVLEKQEATKPLANLMSGEIT